MAVLSFLTYLRGIYKLNLSAASKVHNAIIQSIYDCFIMARDDLTAMRLEMCLSTATGHWLDCWGEFFSVYRKSGETDKSYSKRIIYEVTQPKSTIPAVKDGIINYLNSKYNKSYTREDITVKEPWKEIAKYSHKGTLSNTARFFSGDYYCHAIMDISIPEQITGDLIDLASSIKAAGVGLTLTASSNVAFVEFPWTYADCCQCEDRAHRIGQKDNVTCYYLIGRHTIDRALYDIIHKKKSIANQIMAADDEIPTDEMYFNELASMILNPDN